MIEIRSDKIIYFLCAENDKVALSWGYLLKDVINGNYFKAIEESNSDLEDNDDFEDFEDELTYCPINSAYAFVF